MATQSNPYVAGLNAWASAYDPAEMAKGQLTSQSVANKGLEAEILASRIRHRSGIENDPNVNQSTRNFILMNDAASPQASQNAYETGRASNIINNPNSTPQDIARAMLGRGDVANRENTSLLSGTPLLPNVQFEQDAQGNRYAIVPDPSSRLGWTPLPFGSQSSPKVHIANPGATVFQEGPKGLVPVDTLPNRPMTDAQILAATRQVDRSALGANFPGIEQYVQRQLGAYDADYNRISGKPLLNPLEMASIVSLANKIAQRGYSMQSAIDWSMRKHGISPASVTEKEFQGYQGNPFNWQSDKESDVTGGNGAWLPEIGGGGNYLAGQRTSFYEPTKFNRDWNEKEYLENLPKAQRKNFQQDTEEPVPLRTVSRLTNLGDDMVRNVSEPQFAKDATLGNITPGDFYYRRSPSGNIQYFVARTNASGETELVPEPGQ